jgi:hypothetical protein
MSTLKFHSSVGEFICQKYLDDILSFVNGEIDEALVLVSSETIYSCLQKLEGPQPAAKYIGINNRYGQSHLVLLNNSINLLALFYDKWGLIETFRPVPAKKHRGINSMVCAARYTLFVPLPPHVYTIGEYNLQHYAGEPISAGKPFAPKSSTGLGKPSTGKNNQPSLAEVQHQAAAKLIDNMAMESQVILHCSCHSRNGSIQVREFALLADQFTQHQSMLVYAERISLYPRQVYIPEGETFNFTLMFSCLPKDCTRFDLSGQVKDEKNFVVRNIRRNKSDVYYVNIPA